MAEKKTLKVEVLPYAIRQACLERGWADGNDITIVRAMREWTAWELGDAAWGEMACNMIKEMEDM